MDGRGRLLGFEREFYPTSGEQAANDSLKGFCFFVRQIVNLAKQLEKLPIVDVERLFKIALTAGHDLFGGHAENFRDLLECLDSGL